MMTANNITSFLLNGLKTAREDVEIFSADFLKLLKALSLWAVPFVLSLCVLALLPAIFSIHIGKLVDAVIGARGVGTMTIDVTRAIRWLTGATIAAFLAEMFLSRFAGKAGILARMAYHVGALLVLAVMLMSLGWWGMAIWPLCLIVLRNILMKIPYLHFVFVIPVVLLFLFVAQTVIGYAAMRAITVGSAMTTVGAAGMYAVVVAGILLKPTSDSERT